ncbi:MAG TPA: hypothetical protein VLS90_09730, partial [Thermodesulfobacteriota bacterium]|nr:hypothetical protein [Thermodesulfobacteriota bacterium]
NVLEAAAAVYPRAGQYNDPTLTPKELHLIRRVQNEERHLALSCNRFTGDVIEPDTYRLRLPCQTQTWEVTGFAPAGQYFTRKELQDKDLTGSGVEEIGYHVAADTTTPQKRLVEGARTLFFADDLKTALPFGRHAGHGLPRESYKLALTKSLLEGVFSDAAKLGAALAALSETTPRGFPLGGYVMKDRLFPDDPVTPTPPDEQWWIASGIAGFADDAARHFYLPERYTDPFGNETRISFDPYGLYITSSTDPVGNTVTLDRFDFRVLAPLEITDMNGNHTEVRFDTLGRVVALAVKGKRTDGAWEGDNLDEFTDDLADPPRGAVAAFCARSSLDETQARTWLGNAGARFVYHFGESTNDQGAIRWNARMPGACGIVRERHVSQLGSLETSPIQVSLECSDGSGNVLMRKVQAEAESPRGPLRWIVNGLTVLNNKGKPVKQYEPAFTPQFGWEEPQANGVTPVLYYDAIGRLTRTEFPDGSFSRVEFSPWHVASHDANDTVLEPGNAWYARMMSDPSGEAERRSAALTAVHAATPSIKILDPLGREVITIAHNRLEDPAGNVKINGTNYRDEKYLTFTKLDAEGKPLWIRDSRGNLVMQYILPVKPDRDEGNEIPGGSISCYDIAGNVLFHHSMDAGDRWMLNDAAGKPMIGFEVNNLIGKDVLEERVYSTAYDGLHRPKELWLKINGGDPQVIERFRYGEDVPDPGQSLNLRGKLYRHYDQSGLTETVDYDFKGNPRELRKQRARSYKSPVIDWKENSPASGLEDETFVKITEYDALNRVSRLFNWHKGPGSRVAVYEPAYSARGLLESEQIVVRAIKLEDPRGYSEDAQSRRRTPIASIAYNARGQREII